MKPVVNIVYAYMQPDRIDVDSSSLPYDVIWTAAELPGADCVVIFNGYSYNRRAAQANPSAFRILCVSEPPPVFPAHYTCRLWEKFDAVLTWNDRLAAKSGRMHHFPVPCYDFPFGAIHGVLADPDREVPDLAARRRAICQIVGDKYSPIPGELYSLRRKMARWFYKRDGLPMDVYGRPAMNAPNYLCAPESKLETLMQYRYALCFENYTDPIWSCGYVSEKIFDCMYADCVPVYYGCATIEETVPADCFIDFRTFQTLEELHDHLQCLSDEEYLGYVQRMRAFLGRHHPEHRYSCDRFPEKAWELYSTRTECGSGEWPPDYLSGASVNLRVRYGLMCLGLKMYRWVHPLFNLIRSFDSWTKK